MFARLHIIRVSRALQQSVCTWAGVIYMCIVYRTRWSGFLGGGSRGLGGIYMHDNPLCTFNLGLIYVYIIYPKTIIPTSSVHILYCTCKYPTCYASTIYMMLWRWGHLSYIICMCIMKAVLTHRGMMKKNKLLTQ